MNWGHLLQILQPGGWPQVDQPDGGTLASGSSWTPEWQQQEMSQQGGWPQVDQGNGDYLAAGSLYGPGHPDRRNMPNMGYGPLMGMFDFPEVTRRR